MVLLESLATTRSRSRGFHTQARCGVIAAVAADVIAAATFLASLAALSAAGTAVESPLTSL